jgi:hypothetical protein
VRILVTLLGLAGALIALGSLTVDFRGRPVPLVAATDPGAFGFEPGELVPDFRFRDLDGERGSLAGLLERNRAVVVALRTVECPVSQRYGHRLAELEAAWADRGVAFVFLDVSPQDSEDDMRGDRETFGFDGPYVADPEARIGDILQAGVSTEVFVIDAAGTLRYRGAVDDQFGITFSKPVVHEHYLEEALAAVVDGSVVATPVTEASGCFLTQREGPSVPARDVTYHNRVSRIVQESCVDCHRAGGVAPFALDSYAQVEGFAPMIRYAVGEGLMPPWYASPDHGVWKNDMSLSERDKRDLLAWIEAGMPEGDPSTAPIPKSHVDGWALEREPDAIITLPEPQEIPERGVLDYRYISVPTDFDRDVWVRAAEIRPTAAQQTHHVIAYFENEDAGERQLGAFFMGWAPGMPAVDYGDGAAKRLPKGQTLRFELHYTPNGTAAVDETRLGLIFSDEPPGREVHTSAVTTSDFEIPPHAADHEVVADLEFRRGGTLVSLLPHMHLRGKAFRYELIRSDGSETVVLDVPRYDFNWQLWYDFADPLRVEAGDVLRGRAWYDNSTGNPWNPDPDAVVTYGEQTFEEMMFGFFDWIPDRRGASGAGR